MNSGESLQLHIQHRLIEELAEKERRHRTLLESLLSPVIVLHCGHIAYLNPAWTHELGYPLEASLKRPLVDFVVDSHRSSLTPEACDSIGERADMEIRMRHRDGVETWYELSLTRDEPGKLLGLLHNIDERRKATERARQQSVELRRDKAALELASRQQSTFLACMSHELRTPLNAVLGFAELLAEQTGGKLNPVQLRYLGHITASGHHLLDLINDILDLSRLAEGEGTIMTSTVELASIVESAVRMVKPEADRKQISLSLENAGPTERVRTDARRLKQILVNLLGNAVKFTGTGGQVSIRVEREQDAVLFHVQDNGIGIAPEDMPKLFQPFSQIDNGLNRSHGGTGLGLHLVKRTCELLGGETSVASEPGKGAVFTCRLPLPPVESRPAPTNPSPPEAGPSAPLHVLLVEDDSTNQELITRYLNAKGTKVSVADNGRQACELAIELQPTAILMDIQMPGMDGIQATRQIASHPATQHIPIVALTALAMRGDRERCLAAGASFYLSKPVDLRQLSQLLSTLKPELK